MAIRRKRRVGFALMALTAVVCVAAVAGAQPRPCAADIEKFCKDAPHGGGKVRDCLVQHVGELSPRCKTRLDRAAVRQKHGSCYSDVEKFCKDVRRGGGRIRQCLKEHEASLSDVCKQQLAGAPPSDKPTPKP